MLMFSRYAKNRGIEDAHLLFDKMPTRDVVSWNPMTTGCFICGQAKEVLNLFCEKQREGMCPTQSTFSSVLVACADMGTLEYSKEVHAQIMKSEFGLDVCVDNGLVTAYAKCGSIEDADHMSEKMPELDDVSWRVMFIGNLQNGHVEKALKLIRQNLSLGMGLSVLVRNLASKIGSFMPRSPKLFLNRMYLWGMRL